jgi:hypothetical protein
VITYSKNMNPEWHQNYHIERKDDMALTANSRSKVQASGSLYFEGPLAGDRNRIYTEKRKNTMPKVEPRRKDGESRGPRISQQHDESKENASFNSNSNNNNTRSPNTGLKVTFKNLEIFHANKKDVHSYNSEILENLDNEIKKKSLILPSNLEYRSSSFSCDCTERIKNINTTELEFARSRANFSYKEV